MTSVLLMVIASLALGQQPPRDAVRRPAEAAPSGVIAGRVIVMDSDPAVAIRRARVSLTADHLRQPEISDTGVDGTYRFEGLPAGSYRVTASKPGFVSLEAGARRAGERGHAVVLVSGETTAVDVALPRGAAIDGRLLNEDGDPIQNAIVAAVRFESTATGRRSVAVRQTKTDDLGRYRLHSLPEGEYFVEASPDSRELAGAFVPERERPPGLARTFYPGTAQPHEARAVKLARAQQVAGLEFVAGRVPLVRVGGRVLTSGGKPVREYSVRLHPIDAPISSVAGFMHNDGRFEFRAVPAGEYWVLASLVPSPGAVAEFSAIRMSFGSDMQDLTLTTTPGTVLHGRMEVEGGTLPSLARVSVITMPHEFELPPTRPPAPKTVPRADGSFIINGLFGPNRLTVDGLPSGWEVKRVFLDDKDITNLVVDFRGSNAPRPLRVVLAAKESGKETR